METCVAMAATGLTSPTRLAHSSASSQRTASTSTSSSSSAASSCLVFRQSWARLESGRRAHLRKVESRRWRAGAGVVAMAPDDEKMTRRSPLDFPVEWDRPSPGRRPDIFPQFSPMKTPLPPPLPTDPPEEDEDEEDKKDEDPEKEDKPEE